jgi:hypothetical protein
MTARLSLETLARWLLVVLLLGGLSILLHGCHGDEDNELFAPLIQRR